MPNFSDVTELCCTSYILRRPQIKGLRFSEIYFNYLQGQTDMLFHYLKFVVWIFQAFLTKLNTWSQWASEVAYFLNSLKSKLATNEFFFSMKFWSIPWYAIVIINIMEQIKFSKWFDSIIFLTAQMNSLAPLCLNFFAFLLQRTKCNFKNSSLR